MAAIVTLLNERFEGFTLTELSALLAVCEYEGLSVLSLARVCQMTSATASRSVRRLASPETPGALPPARGLIDLARGPNDHRSRYIFLTPAGRAFCETMDAFLADSVRRPLLARVETEERADRPVAVAR